jgi:WD40 repeat protein
MALQTSGPISLADIAGEFGGDAPYSLLDYYGVADGIPTSGPISFSDFYGASNYVGWLLSNAVYNGNLGYVAGTPVSLTLSADGTKAYSYDIGERLYEFDLSTAYDISTAVHNYVQYVAADTAGPMDITFNPSGTRMIITGGGNGILDQYTLSTAFDISSASYDNVRMDISRPNCNIYSTEFSSDGTKMYTLGLSDAYIFQYSLSTAFDITTASYDNISYAMSFSTSTLDLIISGGGDRLLVLDYLGMIYEVNLSTPYDLSTASYNNVSLDTIAVTGMRADSYLYGIESSPTGDKIYIVNYRNHVVYEFDL